MLVLIAAYTFKRSTQIFEKRKKKKVPNLIWNGLICEVMFYLINKHHGVFIYYFKRHSVCHPNTMLNIIRYFAWTRASFNWRWNINAMLEKLPRLKKKNSAIASATDYYDSTQSTVECQCLLQRSVRTYLFQTHSVPVLVVSDHTHHFPALAC